jgi:LPXTG-motif cell wall-anchored protein
MRAFAVACVSGILLMLLAAPAVAQRDPFAPRVGEPRPVEAGPAQPDPAQPAQPRPQPPAEDPLPATGGEVSSWLAVAYILVMIGAGAIVLGRSFGPLARPRRG